MKLNIFFAQNPIFRWKDFSDFLTSNGSSNITSQRALLAYHSRVGNILMIRRGLYVYLAPGQSPNQISIDPYLITAYLHDDSLLAYHTALSLHGYAYSLRNEYYYLTHHFALPFSFRDIIYRPIAYPNSLLRKQQTSFAVQTIYRNGLAIKVTSLERTMVDLLDRPDLSGGWEEIWRSLETVQYFNLDTLIDYALLLDNSTTIAKVGLFLEQHKEQLMVTPSHLTALLTHIPKQPHYFSPKLKTGSLVGKWNLIVPQNILLNQWDEL